MEMMFSVAIHEKPEVVIDTICNILTFNKNSGIVLHLSRQFNYYSKSMSRKKFFEVLRNLPNVYLNPQSYDTSRIGPGVGSLVNIHISNFKYLKRMGLNFEYFVLAASNELYIKHGMYDYIKGYDYGNKCFDIDTYPGWVQGGYARKDSILASILKNISGDKIYGSQIEGSFYKNDIFEKISQTVLEVSGNKIIGGYACEEVYFPTICKYLFGSSKRRTGNVTYIPWKKKLVITIDDVKMCIDKSNYFSVKRVPREFNSEVREYIRCNVGRYGEKYSVNIPWCINSNDLPDESQYCISDELLNLEMKFVDKEKDIYDVLSYANHCRGRREAEYLLELLLCTPSVDIFEAYNHLLDIVSTNDFFEKMLNIYKGERVNISISEAGVKRNFIILLRVLLSKRQLLNNKDMLCQICQNDMDEQILLDVFLRIESDERIQFFSLKNGNEIWLYYVPYLNSKWMKLFKVPESEGAESWPMAEKVNTSAFAMYIKKSQKGIYYSIEFCSRNEDIYNNSEIVFTGSKKFCVGVFNIVKLEGKELLAEDSESINVAVNKALDSFCIIGNRVIDDIGKYCNKG